MSQDQIAAVAVERVEMVSYNENGWEEPAEPIWRIVLNGYCADFPTEGSARNFAEQIAAVKPVAGQISDTSLLPEDADERRMFNHSVKLYGGPLRAIAGALGTMSKTFPQEGSLAAVCAIYSNEIAKAADAVGEPALS